MLADRAGSDTRRRTRIGLLLALVGAAAWVSLAAVDTASLVAPFWPAAGVAAGLYLTTERRFRPWLLAGLGLLILLVHLAQGYPLGVAAGFTASCLVETWLVRRSLVGPTSGRRAALHDEGDVSRLVGTFARAAAAAGHG